MKFLSSSFCLLAFILSGLVAQEPVTRAGMVYQTDLGLLWLRWVPKGTEGGDGWSGFWKGPQESVRRPPVLGSADPGPEAFKGVLRLYRDGEGYAGDWTEDREGLVLREGSVLLRFEGASFTADLFDPAGRWLRTWSGTALRSFSPEDWTLVHQETKKVTP